MIGYSRVPDPPARMMPLRLVMRPPEIPAFRPSAPHSVKSVAKGETISALTPRLRLTVAA
ncbi:hypothetical protein KU6B_41100 [Mameliella alba]|nr:hypothetical protein KU6B_41100 [Mameliella alba]